MERVKLIVGGLRDLAIIILALTALGLWSFCIAWVLDATLVPLANWLTEGWAEQPFLERHF